MLPRTRIDPMVLHSIIHLRVLVTAAISALLVGCFGEAGTIDGTGETGAGMCPAVEEPEDGPACPATCNGGCVEKECQIVCDAAQPCNMADIVCPPDFACDVDCAGADVCAGAVIACPNDFLCSLTCEGPSACATAELKCGFSECAIECGADETACSGTVVRCSGAACLAECASSVFPSLDGCDASCNCTEC